MKNAKITIGSLLGSLTLASSACTPEPYQSSEVPNSQTRCLDRNLDDIQDIVDAADNEECLFEYDSYAFQVSCPSASIQADLRNTAYTIFSDENNSLDYMGEDTFLRCDGKQFKIDDSEQLSNMHQNLKSRFKDLPF